MLTPLQGKKLTHYFNVLDFDRNGILEKQDFTNIGINLAMNLGMHEGDDDFKDLVQKSEQIWLSFRSFIKGEIDDTATLGEWLRFADKNIVNGSPELYEKHVNIVASEIIRLFDTDDDGYLSLEEYIELFVAYRIDVKYSAKSFVKLDTNYNEEISYDELLEAIRQFYRSDDEKAPGNWLFGFWEDKID